MKKIVELKIELAKLESIMDPYEKIIMQERIDILKTIISLREYRYELISSKECDHSQFGMLNKPLLYLGSYVDNDPHKSRVIYKLGCLECGDWMLEKPKSQGVLNNLIGFASPLKDELNDMYTIEKIKILSLDYHDMISKGLTNKEAISFLKRKYETGVVLETNKEEHELLKTTIEKIIESEYSDSIPYLEYQKERIKVLKEALSSGVLSESEIETIKDKMVRIGILTADSDVKKDVVLTLRK